MAKRRKVWVLILTVLAVYVGLSALLGSPLGFGRIMERTAAKEYCSIVYPQAPLGKTVYNPIASGYQTAVYLDGSDGDRNSIGVDLAERTIYDPSREASFLEESGVGECIAKLERKYGNCYIACRVVWPCSDPSAPVLRLWLDYTDSESTPPPRRGADQGTPQPHRAGLHPSGGRALSSGQSDHQILSPRLRSQ